MLKEKKYKKGDVVVMKLISGEEVIAKIDSTTDNGVSVTKPLVLGLHQDPASGQPVVGLAPYVFGIDESKKISIDSSKWLFITDARKEASDQYLSSTTGIEVVSSSSIIT